MSFDALIAKVHQAEVALEARERQASADWRQARGAWRSLWTPGRIVVAGLATGFLVGRAEPFKKAAGGGAMQLISALGSLIAGENARKAADKADDAATAAEDAGRDVQRHADAAEATMGLGAATVAPAATAPPPPVAARGPTERSRSADARPRGLDPEQMPDRLRDSGRL